VTLGGEILVDFRPKALEGRWNEVKAEVCEKVGIKKRI